MMTKALTILLAAAALLAPLPALAQAAAPIGVNAAIRNQVQMKTARDSAFRAAVVKETVSLGDTVTSGANSALQILLKDRSVFTIGANARMTLDRFVYDPARGTGDVAATVAKGAFRFMSGKALARGGGKTINTAVASIGVRGTIVEGAVGPEAMAIAQNEPALANQIQGANTDNATLIVLRGPGPNTNGIDKPGEIDITPTAGGPTTTVDQPGQAVFVGGNSETPVTFPISEAGVAALAGELRTTPTGSAADTGPPVQTVDTAPATVLAQDSVVNPGTSGNTGTQSQLSQALGPAAIYDVTGNEFPVRPATDPATPCPPGRFCPR